MKERKTLVAAFIYVAALCSANLLIYVFGPLWSVVNSFFLIGLDFILRDRLHDRIGFYRVTGLSVLAGTISYVINPAGGMIALASSVSFIIAAIGDGSVYQALIRHKWIIRSNASNVISSAIDSVVFPMIAFGALMPHIVIGQFLAKVAGGAVWSLILTRAEPEK